MRGYQENFSDHHAEVYFDADARARKAGKMLCILRDAVSEDLSRLHVLDIGCSTGAMGLALGEHFGNVTGIDIDYKAVEWALARPHPAHVTYRVGDAMATGLEAESVDVVICSHVYEHVPDANLMLDEILRVLVPGGACFFAAENRLTIREGDYRLPFLSWLPKPLAHVYLRLAGRGNHYYEQLHTLPTLRRMTRAFECHDYTRRVIADPSRFDATDMVPPGSFKQRAALMLVDLAYPLVPTYLWVLRKPPHSG